MWQCPSCGADVDDDFEVCWSCGTSPDGEQDPSFQPERDGIVTADTFEADRAAKTNERLVTVAVLDQIPAAHNVRSRLEAEGIQACVVGDVSAAAFGFLTNALGGIKVQVFERDAERAREIIAEAEAPFVEDAREYDHEEEDE